MSRLRDDRGSVAIELAILMSAVVVLLGIFAVIGMMSSAASTVEQAASQAARSASIERTGAAASSMAQQTALTALTEQDLHCVEFSVDSDVSVFATSAGTAGQVSVHVSCTVDFSHLPVPGLSTRTYTGQGSSPVDTYRERG